MIFFIILHSSFFIKNVLTIFYGILYFLTLEVRYLGENQYIKKTLRTSLAILMSNRNNFSEKCSTVAILRSIAFKKLFCRVNYMYNKYPIL